MLLTITTMHRPATDLGHLLRKHPGKVHEFSLNFGRASVFYPEATEERCTAALLVEVDPVGLVRGRRGPAGEGRQLEQYVNDRPYAASSFLSVAIAEVFGSALAGKSKDRPELAETAIPLEAKLPTARFRGQGDEFIRKLFEPLGYSVDLQRHVLDEASPAWGLSPYYALTLRGTVTLQQLLTHIYVLIPVLDNEKHYWVGDDEVEKLLKRGEGWLASHPEKEAITRRYLKYRRSLADDALQRLTPEAEEAGIEDKTRAEPEEQIEHAISLNEQRLSTVLDALKQTGAKRVLDLGCGEGRLLSGLLKEKQFEHIAGMDVSHRALEIAQERLHFDRMPAIQRARITLFQGSLMYRDARLEGYDAAAVVEVIEHLDPPRLAAFERVVFERARPRAVVVTTPNAEFNVKWESLPAGKFRHGDHRFEWTRAQFQEWANALATRFGYTVQFSPVGPEDPLLGSPTQMALFTEGGA
jgi:3' terminal RNA ribose 2'-O-methyltransferase Hen1